MSVRRSLRIGNISGFYGDRLSAVVYDDVFTDGFTLNEVARCLKNKGNANEVCGVTLARQPWRSR